MADVTFLRAFVIVYALSFSTVFINLALLIGHFDGVVTDCGSLHLFVNTKTTLLTSGCCTQRTCQLMGRAQPALSAVMWRDKRLRIPFGQPIFGADHSRLSTSFALLLLIGGVEINPGPTVPTVQPSVNFGLLNARSAKCKAALIHDVIADSKLDLLALTETWIPSDAPNAVKLDIAPTGYQVLHRHRGSSSDKNGGGIALIYRESMRASILDLGNYSEFEYLAAKVSTNSKSLAIIALYRPPGPVNEPYCAQLSDLVEQLMLSDFRFVLCGDFNSPSRVNGCSVHADICDIFERSNLVQHVNQATHNKGGLLDLIVSPENCQTLVSKLSVSTVCFSDHSLITCRLGFQWKPPTAVTYTYRQIKRINTEAFKGDLLASEIFKQGLDCFSADLYADLLDAELGRVLERHAPLKTSTRRCGVNTCQSLSEDAREAKKRRRRLERRSRRTGLVADKTAYKEACKVARDSIMASRADDIRRQLGEVKGDHRATWRTAHKLLHTQQRNHYNEGSLTVTELTDFFQN